MKKILIILLLLLIVIFANAEIFPRYFSGLLQTGAGNAGLGGVAVTWNESPSSYAINPAKLAFSKGLIFEYGFSNGNVEKESSCASLRLGSLGLLLPLGKQSVDMKFKTDMDVTTDEPFGETDEKYYEPELLSKETVFNNTEFFMKDAGLTNPIESFFSERDKANWSVWERIVECNVFNPQLYTEARAVLTSEMKETYDNKSRIFLSNSDPKLLPFIYCSLYYVGSESLFRTTNKGLVKDLRVELIDYEKH